MIPSKKKFRLGTCQNGCPQISSAAKMPFYKNGLLIEFYIIFRLPKCQHIYELPVCMRKF